MGDNVDIVSDNPIILELHDIPMGNSRPEGDESSESPVPEQRKSPSSSINIKKEIVHGKTAVYIMMAIAPLQFIKLLSAVAIVGYFVCKEIYPAEAKHYLLDIDEQLYLSFALLMTPLSVGFVCVGCSIFSSISQVSVATLASILKTFTVLYVLQLNCLLAGFLFCNYYAIVTVTLLWMVFYEGSVLLYVDWLLVRCSCPCKYSVITLFMAMKKMYDESNKESSFQANLDV